MDYFAGLDVSVKETSVCIVDDTGKIVREVKVASEPEALLAVLKHAAYDFKRVGLEAGPLSQWLFSALAEAELPVICVETRHMQAVLKAQINKTDHNDARGRQMLARRALAKADHVTGRRSFDETEGVPRHGRHDPLVLLGPVAYGKTADAAASVRLATIGGFCGSRACVIACTASFCRC